MFLDLNESVNSSYMDENMFVEACLELEEQWSELTEKAMRMEHYCYVQNQNGNRSEAMNLYNEGVGEWAENARQWFQEMWDKIRELIDNCIKWIYEHFSRASRLNDVLNAIDSGDYDKKKVSFKTSSAIVYIVNDIAAASKLAYGDGFELYKNVDNITVNTDMNAMKKNINEGIKRLKNNKIFTSDIDAKKNSDKKSTKVTMDMSQAKALVQLMVAAKNYQNELKDTKNKANKAIKRAIKACDSKNSDDKKLVKKYKTAISLNNKGTAFTIKGMKKVITYAGNAVAAYIKQVRIENRNGSDYKRQDYELESASVLDMFN